MHRHVAINPGHYPGLDSGAVGNGLQEADITLAVAKMAEAKLQAMGYQVTFIHENDLEAIVSQANAAGTDVFVSIHCNSFADPLAEGTETWYYPGSNKSRQLARIIQCELINALSLVDRGIKEKEFYVLKYTAMPAALAEIAFISNLGDASAIDDPCEQDAVAAAITRGLDSWFGEQE